MLKIASGGVISRLAFSPEFLSCLCGSELVQKSDANWYTFLSCLCGSEHRTNWAITLFKQALSNCPKKI
jgi:hypothetical protein